MKHEDVPQIGSINGSEEPKLEDFMRTSTNLARNSILITGSDTPTTRFHQTPVGQAPLGEQIGQALENDDYETARALYQSEVEQHKK